uniref:Uncharacterized protein n=1 Tax=Arundo donax TaxID=35708 RepID=A0A0A9GUC6_ARUDO
MVTRCPLRSAFDTTKTVRPIMWPRASATTRSQTGCTAASISGPGLGS